MVLSPQDHPQTQFILIVESVAHELLYLGMMITHGSRQYAYLHERW